MQCFKRALKWEPISWNGSRFHQIVKGISFNYWKTISEGILTRDSRCFHWVKSNLFKFENCRIAYIDMNFYNTVGSSKNDAYKRNRKIYEKSNNCFNITYKFDWQTFTFKSLLTVKRAKPRHSCPSDSFSVRLKRISHFSSFSFSFDKHVFVSLFSVQVFNQKLPTNY